MKMSDKSAQAVSYSFLVMAFALGLTGAAAAKTLTLGSFGPAYTGDCSSCALFARKSDTGEPSYKVPAGNWTITEWAARGSLSGSGHARLQVWRATGTPGQFKLVKESTREKVAQDGKAFFATNLKVKGGDLLGIRTYTGVASGYHTENSVDSSWIVNCNPSGVGQLAGKDSECPLTKFPGDLTNIKAKLTKQ
jgi:hypothetical protein